MHLREVDAVDGQPNARYPFTLVPPTAPMELAKPIDFPGEARRSGSGATTGSA
jgi:hypothetical protein